MPEAVARLSWGLASHGDDSRAAARSAAYRVGPPFRQDLPSRPQEHS